MKKILNKLRKLLFTEDGIRLQMAWFDSDACMIFIISASCVAMFVIYQFAKAK